MLPENGMRLVALMIWGQLAAFTLAGETTAISPEALQFFEAKIRPLLVEQCYGCHSNDGQGVRGGLMVDTREGLLGGGESGAAVVPGDLDASLLWSAINYQDLRMPPKKQLPREVIEDIRKWILMGAPDPRVAEHVIHSTVSADDIEKGKQFWSFRPPLMPSIPSVSDAPWPKTDIDRFVLAKMEKNQLKPNGDADAYTFLRRLHFDLTGLPPSVAAIRSFVRAWEDDRDAAIAKEVDRLLDSQQYGERWARHWLDVARYAESSGKEVDMSFPHAWRYRDYVIDSFNRDKPYDRFVQEQIAGDLLPAKTDKEWTENLIATGFLAIGPKTLVEQNPRQFQADLIDEQIDTTTRVILGISVACARCHDHKFDPIVQTDYYALAGIFQSTETFFGGATSQRIRQASNLLVLPVADLNPFDKAISTAELANLKDELELKKQEYAEARRAQRLGTTAANKKGPGSNLFLLDLQISQLTNRINGVDERGKPLSFCMGVQSTEFPRNARVLARGEINQPTQEVPRGFVQVIGPYSQKVDTQASGRLELARWLTNRDNPLTARVMVNRIWQHLLGQAIVQETENFGASGPGATHPELLDYLAVRFMATNWSVKSLIRDVVNSRVYRISSQYREEVFEKDPDNLYIARANPRRLDAESIRDAMLLASGQLDTKRPRASTIATVGQTVIGPGGIALTGTPAMNPPAMNGGPLGRFLQPQPSKQRMLGPGGRPGGNSVTEVPSRSRSIYLPIVRNALPRALEVFDFAEPSMVVGQREMSNTSAQALFVLNNPLVIQQSDALAARLSQESRTPAEQVKQAFLTIYGRPALAKELEASSAYLRSLTSSTKSRSSEPRPVHALSQFCQALFASADFRFVN